MDPERSNPIQLLVKRLENGLIIILLSAMICLAFGQLAARNLGSAGLVWGEAALRHLVLWVGLLGAMAASREDKHIAIDAVAHFLPARLKSAAKILTDLFTIGVCAWLTSAAVAFVIEDRAAGVEAFAGLPAWWLELILPLGFGMIGLRYLFRALSRLLRLLTGRTTAPGPGAESP